MPAQGASGRSMTPVCRACKEPERPYQPLVRCLACKRRYHAACYNPPPLDPRNWTCKKCMKPESSKRHHETWSSTTFATQNSSSSTPRPQLDPEMSRTGFVFSSHSSDAAGTMGFPDKIHEKSSNATVQPLKPKLLPESKSGNNGYRIKMAKTAPGPILTKSIQTSKQSPSFTAAPRLVASPNSTKSASQRRSIYSPRESSTSIGSPAQKKVRKSSGHLNNTNHNVVQPPADDFSSRQSARIDHLPVIAPFQNGSYQRHTSKDHRNGVENGSLARTASQPWHQTESDSWLPLQVNQTNGFNINPYGSRPAGSGFPAEKGLNQRLEDYGAPSLFNSYRETSSLQASNGLGAANGLSQEAVRDTFPFDGIKGPRNKTPPAFNSTANLDAATARWTEDALGTKTRPRVSKETIEPISNKPPLRAQREPLAKALSSDSPSLDALIYGQEGAALPPPGVIVPEAQLHPAKDERFFAHIDPRVHWCRPHSTEWREKKQAEIKARGGRKANFGKAAERLKKQRLENPVPEEELLPEHVRENPEWMRARAWFKECSQKDWEKDKAATKRAEAEAEAKLKTKTGGRRR